MYTNEDAGRRLKPMAAMKQNLVFDAAAPALAEMATDQRKQADPYASDYKLGAKELSFTTPALYTTLNKRDLAKNVEILYPPI